MTRTNLSGVPTSLAYKEKGRKLGPLAVAEGEEMVGPEVEAAAPVGAGAVAGEGAEVEVGAGAGGE